MKKTVSILIVISIFISLFAISPITVSAADESGITITSGRMKVLSDVNSDNLKYELEKFTDEELATVDRLVLSYANLSIGGLNNEDLSYILNYLPNVTYLFCKEQNNLSDISFIKGKTSLTYINFSENNISDISPIISCPNLDYIYFGYNKITDISPIYALSKLDSVWLNNNQIQDVTGLKEYYEENAPFSHFFLDNNPLGNQLDYIKSINGSSKISLNGVYYPDEAATVTEEDFRPLIYKDVTVDDATKTITINSNKDDSYVAIGTQSPITKPLGQRVSYSIAEVAGEVEKYVSTRYKIYKPKDSNTYTTTLTASAGSLTPVEYTLVVNFVETPATFEVSKMLVSKATGKAYDAETSALTIDANTNFVRIYKNVKNGLKLSIDTTKFDFITENNDFYQINGYMLKTSDLNIAKFEITTSGGETLNTTVNYPGAGNLPLKQFTISKCSEISQSDKTITLDIADGCTYTCVYKKLKDGTTLTIESDSPYVEEREDRYVLRSTAAGENITLNYSGSAYTVNLVK